MKKTIIALGIAAFALAACNKENVTPHPGEVIDASKVVFNITVSNAEGQDTKGIKTGWENGDIVYVFFEDNSDQYVRMYYNGFSWDYSDKDNGNSYTGLTLTATEVEADKKHVTAIYFPSFVNNTAPTLTEGKFGFTNMSGYYLTANEKYTVTTTDVPGGVSTLTVNLQMKAPENLIQVYVPVTTPPESGYEYVFTMTNVSPFTMDAITPGSAVTCTPGAAGNPIKHFRTIIGGEAGYYCWGVLHEVDADNRDYFVQLVNQKTGSCAVSSWNKKVSAKLTGSTAIKLSSPTNDNFVHLGGSVFWATGNLTETSPYIAAPTEDGSHYMYGYTTPYDSSGAFYTGTENPLDKDHDAAHAKNSAWRMPTKDEFVTLSAYGNYRDETIRCRVFTGSNGIKVFFRAPGYLVPGNRWGPGFYGRYWSSTPESVKHVEFDENDEHYEFDVYLAYSLQFDFSLADDGLYLRRDSYDTGLSIRPVKD